ncbi:MAG: hypothetical protein IBX68_09925 [Dehalococcoidia bacterium]|nr:hypothetical protein [Dehalococcoidia bacterium]
MARHGIHVFVNSRKVELDSRELTGAELLQRAGFETQHWDIYRLENPSDLKGSRVTCEETLQVRDGDFFRVVQGHASCG